MGKCKVRSLLLLPTSLCPSHTWDSSLLPPLPGVHPHTAWHILSKTKERMEERREVRGGELEKFSHLENCFKAKRWKTKITHWETPWRILENEAEWFLWILWNLTQICHLAVKPTRNVSLSINSFIVFRDFPAQKTILFLSSCIKCDSPASSPSTLDKQKLIFPKDLH